jgi:hypothetical protein
MALEGVGDGLLFNEQAGKFGYRLIAMKGAYKSGLGCQ